VHIQAVVTFLWDCGWHLSRLRIYVGIRLCAGEHISVRICNEQTGSWACEDPDLGLMSSQAIDQYQLQYAGGVMRCVSCRMNAPSAIPCVPSTIDHHANTALRYWPLGNRWMQVALFGRRIEKLTQDTALSIRSEPCPCRPPLLAQPFPTKPD
jgi:hypothetical protein